MKIPALLTILILPLSLLAARPTNAQAAAPTFPIRAAFYYPWFPETWGPVSNRYTHYTPTLGYYNSSDAATIDDHIARMEYAGINVGIASWWGQGSKTDQRISLLLAEAHSRNFYWTLYYEPALSSTQVALDLTYIATHYGSDPNFLHVNGKPVLFIYTRAVNSCTDVATWETANAGQFYLDPQVFAGYRLCSVQPASWHQYAPTSAEDKQTGYSFSISPGFWLATDAAPRLVRDPSRWRLNVQDMVASGAPWQLVTTFNEWGEGTAVEDAVQWQSPSQYGVYLDELSSNGHGLRVAAQSSAPPLPVRTCIGLCHAVLKSNGLDGRFHVGAPGDSKRVDASSLEGAAKVMLVAFAIQSDGGKGGSSCPRWTYRARFT
ncbi:MAG: hypothetical protein E6I00_09010 [Chloroflexi bacterium]|nr:MAG: hypothetical protein E6I00_09010 [Chloroflexota bacterium]